MMHLMLPSTLTGEAHPSSPARKQPLPFDRELYRLRNRVERLVNRLKQFRAVATRYDKTAESFLAFVQLAASRLWLRFVHRP